jgi:peptidoglycan/LPS O-acetylase OafA/YrhL
LTATSDNRDCERRTELPALTALRGLAALMVLLYHSAYIGYAGAPPAIWRRGYIAIDLFFFLSGFVLTHVYSRRLARNRNWRAIGEFAWARFCRIYPASFFTTGLFVLAFTIGDVAFPAGVSFKAQVIAALLLTQVPWLSVIIINPPAWSLSAEWCAYLIFPFLVPAICRLRRGIATTVGIALLLAVGIDHSIFSHDQQHMGWGALLRALPEFAVGIFAYRWYSERLLRTIWEKDATFVGVVGAMIAANWVCNGSDGPTAVLLLALLLASVCNSGRMARLLNAGPLRSLGEISYTLYIFQMIPLGVSVAFSGLLVAHGFGGARLQAIAVLLTVGSSVLVHRCVDLPVRAALRRLPDRVMAVAVALRRAMPTTVSLVLVPAAEHDR